MSYQVTARKWRPMVFEDVIGQTHVTNTLKNALATNRLAHAFIFCGGRGCGKTTTARILAKAINCLHPKDSNPCNECEVCAEITNGRSMDVVEIDGATHSTDEEIAHDRRRTAFLEAQGYRVVRFSNQQVYENVAAIIDEIAHVKMQNACLTSARESADDAGTGGVYSSSTYREVHHLLTDLIMEHSDGATASWTAHTLLTMVRADLLRHLTEGDGMSSEEVRLRLRQLVSHLVGPSEI